MLRSFSTLCCLEKNLQEVISLALSARMQGVEIRVGNDGTLLGGMTVENAEEIRKAFVESGLVITDLGISVSFSEYDTEKLAEARNAVDLAAAVGAGAIRLFLGKFQHRFSQTPVDDIPGIARALQELCAYAAEKQVEIWIETHSEFSTGKSLREILDLVPCENLNVIWDVIHPIEYGESLAETAAYLGDRVAHVHVKDGVPTEDHDLTQYHHTDLGEGVVPIREFLALLRKMNYTGFLSLEWEKPWRPEIQHLYPDTQDLLVAFNRWIETNDDTEA